MKKVWAIFKESVNEFLVDPVLSLSAATAYYAVFSIGPLLVMVVGLAGLVFGNQNVQQEVARQLRGFVGPRATQIIESMMSAQMRHGTLLTVILGAVALLFGATGVFLQLQQSLDLIWGVKTKPGHGLWLFIRDRVLSLAMVLAIGFLLLVSMALSMFVTAFTHLIGRAISLPDWLAPLFNELASLVVIAMLFALIFKVLPDVRIRWRDVWAGALGTAALFSGGKYLLGLYLSHETDVSAYGAGSAFVVILLYIYYASVILYFGAEFTRIYARHQGLRIEPSRYAIRANQRKHAQFRASALRTHVSPARGGGEPAGGRRKGTGRGPRKSFARRLLGGLGIAVPAAGLLLIGLRLALPYLALDYVNHTLKQVQDFAGSVKGVRIDLYRGAYTLKDVVLVKTNAQTREPFLIIPEMDLAVQWHQLFHGHLVGRVIVNHPRVNFENGPEPQQKQIGMHKNWKQTLEKLFPFTINRFQVNDGTLHFADPHRRPPVDMSISSLYATATNLTNVRNKKTPLPAGLIARGRTTGNGRLTMQLHMNPLAHAPTFKLIAGLTNVDLTALNSFMESYGKFDVENGKFALYLDIAAAHQQYQGYLKPFFFGLRVFTLHEAAHKNIAKDFWEAIVAGVTRVLRNQPRDQLATTIPISGGFQQGSNVDLWSTVGGILQNAFVRALLPKVNHPSVPLPGGPANAPPATPKKR